MIDSSYFPNTTMNKVKELNTRFVHMPTSRHDTESLLACQITRVAISVLQINFISQEGKNDFHKALLNCLFQKCLFCTNNNVKNSNTLFLKHHNFVVMCNVWSVKVAWLLASLAPTLGSPGSILDRIRTIFLKGSSDDQYLLSILQYCQYY